MACEPCACRSQCGEIAALTPALAAVRFTIPCTARAVSRPPLRLANTGSFAPASPRNVSSDRLTMSGKSTWRGFSPLPRMESCTRPFSRGSTSAHVRLTISLTRKPPAYATSIRMRSRLEGAARISNATSAGVMIRLARLAPRLPASFCTLMRTPGIEGHVPQLVPIAQQRLDAQRVLACGGSAGTHRGGDDCIAHVFHGGGAQPHGGQHGEESLCRHREVAPAVRRPEAVEPGRHQLVIVAGARGAQGLDADDRKLRCIVGHLQPLIG